MSSPAKPTSDPSHDALILEVLREVLARQSAAASEADPVAREGIADVGGDASTKPSAVASSAPTEPETSSRTSSPQALPASPQAPPATRPVSGRPWTDPESGLTRAELDRIAAYEERANEPAEPPLHVARSLVRLFVGVLVAAVVVNVPLVHGRPLTQALPDRTALIIRDGLLLKGDGPEVFVLEDGHKRWVHSLAVFEASGFDWDDVHTVDAEYLALFPDGRPLFQLLRCADSPHVYRIEDGRKRWIKDIPTLLAEGHRWEDIDVWPCRAIAEVPLGPPIPPDAGRPASDASTGEGGSPTPVP